MRSLACLALLLLLAACRTARIHYAHPLEEVPFSPPLLAAAPPAPLLPRPAVPPAPLREPPAPAAAAPAEPLPTLSAVEPLPTPPPEPPPPEPPPAPTPPPVVVPRPVPVPVAGSASVMIQTMGNLRGHPGYMRYAGDVVAIDGVPFRAARKTFRVSAGKHVITVAWRNYQVPDWAGVGYDGKSGVLFLGEGVSDAEIDAAPNRYYEVKWPYDDEPGGPLGFRDVTMPQR